MKYGILAYGERPITEMILFFCLKEDVDEILNNIKFKNHDRHNIFNGKSKLKNIFIEPSLPNESGTPDIFFEFEDFNLLCEVKPRSFRESLRKNQSKNNYLNQIKRYHDYIERPEYLRNLPLVKRISDSMKNKTILIIITDDKDFPKELDEIIAENKWDFKSVGWLPYNILKQIAKNHNYEIKGKEPHIWIEKNSN